MIVDADIQSWMSRKTMVPMQKPKQKPFAGAREFVLRDITLDSSNYDYMFDEVACAA